MDSVPLYDDCYEGAVLEWVPAVVPLLVLYCGGSTVLQIYLHGLHTVPSSGFALYLVVSSTAPRTRPSVVPSPRPRPTLRAARPGLGTHRPVLSSMSCRCERRAAQ
eukprot:6188951-Pleurochrysis_carterae.AAC.2